MDLWMTFKIYFFKLWQNLSTCSFGKLTSCFQQHLSYLSCDIRSLTERVLCTEILSLLVDIRTSLTVMIMPLILVKQNLIHCTGILTVPRETPVPERESKVNIGLPLDSLQGSLFKVNMFPLWTYVPFAIIHVCKFMQFVKLIIRASASESTMTCVDHFVQPWKLCPGPLCITQLFLW